MSYHSIAYVEDVGIGIMKRSLELYRVCQKRAIMVFITKILTAFCSPKIPDTLKNEEENYNERVARKGWSDQRI